MAAPLPQLLDVLISSKPLSGPRKARISVEELLHWAFAPGREGGIAWKADATLSLDQGLTARPRRRPRGSWIIAAACAGMRLSPTGTIRLVATTDPDALIVANAVSTLPKGLAERVRAHARARSRPDWMDTAITLVPRLNDTGKPAIEWTNNRHKKVQFCPLDEIFTRSLTPASKKRWTDWRDSLALLQTQLVNQLERWEVSVYLPLTEPWR